ncbi:AraC family transcriptional regulator ligand-binding domain-containing protein [Pseudooctadecabacter sp.]|uniref:AraC family transcriptional regulator n=1 Tax=Pseudooctadecabacter sp. TaxID=1966338 RepID=UPI0035C7F01F
MSELGLDVETVVRRAGLSSGVLDGDGSSISLDEYYGLWASVTVAADDPLLALKLGDAAGIDYFDPAFFAAMCSQDMNMAVTRLADYKQRVSPFGYDVQIEDHATQIAFRGPANAPLHPTLALTEIVFLVNFARRATRHPVKPLSVSTPFDVTDRGSYEAHFGCPIRKADRRSVTFSAADAERPFVTHNDDIWDLFEPRLKRQVAQSDPQPTVRTRVSHCLNAFLPSGRASVEEVALELAMSKRTLQRRLAEEGTNWLEVLSDARETLAKHYLATTEYGTAEVSFLLGYEDPNSFFRAFKRWENTSPESWRVRYKDQRARP